MVVVRYLMDAINWTALAGVLCGLALLLFMGWLREQGRYPNEELAGKCRRCPHRQVCLRTWVECPEEESQDWPRPTKASPGHNKKKGRF